MTAPSNIEVTSCVLGGHLLGRGTAVQKELQEKYPEAQVESTKGHLLQFLVVADGETVVGKTYAEGASTMVKMLLCISNPKSVANQVQEAEKVQPDV